jgi:hypothetical protein
MEQKRRGAAPGERRGGRVKGTPNKITKELKQMVLEALERKGGTDYLMAQADANPSAFMTLLGKVLPMTIAGDPRNPVVHEVRVSLVRPEHRDT